MRDGKGEGMDEDGRRKKGRKEGEKEEPGHKWGL